jgi:hypothetical protein
MTTWSIPHQEVNMPVIIVIVVIGLLCGGCGKKLTTDPGGSGTDTTTVSK